MTEKTQKERLLESLAKKKAAKEAHSALCKEILAEIEGDSDGSLSRHDEWELDYGADDRPIFMQYPITVTGITDEPKNLWSPGWRDKPNQLVAVRPCGEQYEGKTYLGIYIGDVALACTVYHFPESGLLKYQPTMHNPAIYVPELQKIIFGIESWWGAIKSEDDLKAITDERISNVWYVQAMKQLGIEPKALDKETDDQAQT